MENREQILQIVRIKGPVLPVQISKEINTNILFASAILSELVDKKYLRLTSTKIGGSPLYYAPGQEHKLQSLYEHLHEKEKKAYDLLRAKKILEDKKQEPVIRAALRQIRDFAKPIEVNLNNNIELFWKWYMLPEPETADIIKNLLGIKEQKKEVQEPKKELKPEQEVKKEPVQVKPEIKKETKPEEKPKESFVDKTDTSDMFLKKIKNYFEKNNIKVLKQDIIRKNSEADFLVEIPSSVGSLKYYCKAKAKQKCNDGDLSSAFVQGQTKKMPVLFLMSGQLTKKALQMLKTEFSNVTVKQL
ncbi:hypothetical protein KY339_02160 [Candidatus Woesearchaeota archaeon]|nr:hypothetical protein [Candidatus Woesearchaeota archaeon]